MKKVIKGCIVLLFFGGMVGSAVYLWMLYKHNEFIIPTKRPEKAMWVTDKPVPETAELGAYLAALNAVFEEDPEKAATYYLKAVAGDHENKRLLKEAYLFNAILGNFEALRGFVNQLPVSYQRLLFADYVKIAYAAQENNWSEVRAQIKPVPVMGDIVNPLLLAWSYAGDKNYPEAMKALEPLLQVSGMEAYYNYHKGLISSMFGQVFAADEAFQALATKKLPTFSLYPEIKSFYIRQGSWGQNNPFYASWQKFEADQPATAELIMRRPAEEITANRGIAEVFYNLSTAMGSRGDDYEQALILSGLSLFLNPQQALPIIWSAEVLEQAKKPQLAAYFYARLSNVNSQTIDFKKAMNLIACGRESEAEKILLRLKRTNMNNVALWWAFASVYQTEKNWPAALDAYMHIIDIVGESNREYASDVYFSRAFIYSEQKQDQKAESDLKHALELNPENPMLLNHLGYLWLEDDAKVSEGVKLVEKAYQLKPSDPHIIDSMAFAYYRQEDYQRALPLAEKTVDMMPQSSVANAHLGDIYEALGRHREAVFQYRKALALKYDLTPELKNNLQKKIEK